MRAYVTLFAENYLVYVLALYRSMEQHCGDFRLYCLCMDDMALALLGRLKLSRVVPIAYKDAETPALKNACSNRTLGEKCWTFTPVAIRIALRLASSDARRVTYLDADTFFFFSPETIFRDEIDKVPISIVPHRLAPRVFSTHWENGQYNVNFVTFDRSALAAKCLVEWEEDCTQWCYRQLLGTKDGDRRRMGDQVYWNEYAARYPVYSIWNPGIGYAPWSFGLCKVGPGPNLDGWPLIQFHAHEFKWDGGTPFLTNHPVSAEEAKHIYEPYIAAFALAQERIRGL